VRKDSEAHQRLFQDPIRSFEQELSLRFLKETPNISIGVLGDTPAASEANRRLSPFLTPTQLISKGSEEDLLNWLEDSEEKVEQRIAVCDHVVAKQTKKPP
jgi:hypothetical protein